ncbi:alpha/beta hydrolase [Hanstruepera ponticola]|uniref:alpha/beta hydrolase n=1 Tax=Hanstruepera ponticola TaxID=2042995 RepID=UPI0017815624|nr:alpha/beta hydrolase [Hanstruepera ponticola]
MSYTHQKSQKSKVKKILLIILGLYVMIGALLYMFQEKLIFLPTALDQNYTYNFKRDFEEIFLNTDDETIINAIHFKAKQPKGVILYFHGNASDLSRWGATAQYFTQYNYDVFVIDYRTYGKSTGPLNEKAFYHDAQFCYDYLRENYEEQDIVLYGRSLGTGVATYLASENTPKNLILETPYYSLVDVAQRRFPIFPVRQLMRYEFPSFKFMKKVNCPVLILHGTNDQVVPLASGKKLRDISNPEQTIFVEVEGANHNNLIDYEAYHEAIKNQLQ